MKRLILFGDSITTKQGSDGVFHLNYRLEWALENFHIINAGVPGNNTRDAIARVHHDVLAYTPDYVTVFFGANDAAFHKMIPLDEYKNNLLQIVQTISPTRTILISPAPIDETLHKKRTNAVLQDYADVVLTVSLQMNCAYINLFYWMIEVPTYPEMLANQKNDGLHFGKKGYDFLAFLIVQKITSLIN